MNVLLYKINKGKREVSPRLESYLAVESISAIFLYSVT